MAMHDFDYRITDLSGEQYYFKEAALALSRTLRQSKESSTSGTRRSARARRVREPVLRSSPPPQTACRKGLLQGPQHPGPHVQRRRSARRAGAAVSGGGMSNEVYANMMEVSCKAASGQDDLRVSRRVHDPAADTCHATGGADSVSEYRDGVGYDDGSTTVKISGKEVMLKNKSCFKQEHGRRGRLRAARRVWSRPRTPARCTSRCGRWT